MTQKSTLLLRGAGSGTTQTTIGGMNLDLALNRNVPTSTPALGVRIETGRTEVPKDATGKIAVIVSRTGGAFVLYLTTSQAEKLGGMLIQAADRQERM